MYVFISAVFFLILFSGKSEEEPNNAVQISKTQVNAFRQHLADSLRQLIDKNDTATVSYKKVNEVCLIPAIGLQFLRKKLNADERKNAFSF